MDGQIDVLIVGAGPVGLLMASELARHGIQFRIIDKKNVPNASSNATWIQTLTIELFDHIGILEQFIKSGNSCDAINLYVDGKSIVKIPLTYIESLYKYILMLPQSETEKLLTEYLKSFGFQIERSTELIDLKQNRNVVKSKVRYANGEGEIITSRYLIACDGANSTVREKCKIFFPGKDLKEQFVVADAIIDSYMSKKEIHAFFSEGEIFAAFPLGSDRYRISANLHLPVIRKLYFENEIIEMAQDRAHGAFYVKSVSWVSTFWIHGKIIKKMRHGPVFFCGDAAHIHSPAGGQGMNTGFQDVYNLAWKLALVIKEKAKSTLLDTYHKERHPVVSEIVRENNHYTEMAIADKNFIKKLRQFSNKLHKSTARIAKKIGMNLTQLSIQYNKSPIIKYNAVKIKSLSPGEHAANVAIDERTKLYDYLHNNEHNILLFTGFSRNKITELVTLKDLLNQKYAGVIKSHIVAVTEFDTTKLILDVNGNIHKHYQIKKPTIYILRPDNYIAYRSTNLSLIPIHHFLKKYLYL